MKFLKTIRFDMSDDNVFGQAASPDEWAVSGAFAFADIERTEITGKTKQAFANGFLGLASFGRSTFASVTEIAEADLAGVEQALAAHFIASHGAPDEQAAMPAAKQEAAFILDLCKDPLINTVFTVRRHFDEDGQIREEFRTIQPPSGQPMHSRIWDVVDDDA